MFTPYITPTILWELDLLVYGPIILGLAGLAMICYGLYLMLWSRI